MFALIYSVINGGGRENHKKIATSFFISGNWVKLHNISLGEKMSVWLGGDCAISSLKIVGWWVDCNVLALWQSEE